MKNLHHILFLVLLIFSGCADDGEPGPQGPKGEQGEQGEQGIQGEQGNANLIYSEWITPDWRVSGSALEWFVNEKNLTDEVYSKGIMVMYYKDEAGNALSINNPHNLVTFTLAIKSYDPENSYNIYLRAVSPEAWRLERVQDEYQFRYVLIPGTVPTGRAKAPDFSDYEAIVEYYNIPG